MTDETTRCLYCDAWVEDETEVPAVDDDEAWQRLVGEHGWWCEWLLTRAHRLPMPEGETCH